jgi:hypothetical protein
MASMVGQKLDLPLFGKSDFQRRSTRVPVSEAPFSPDGVSASLHGSQDGVWVAPKLGKLTGLSAVKIYE